MGFNLYTHIYGQERETKMRPMEVDLEESESLAVVNKNAVGTLYARVRGLIAEAVSAHEISEGLALVRRLLIGKGYIKVESIPVNPIYPDSLLKKYPDSRLHCADLKGNPVYLVKTPNGYHMSVSEQGEIKEVLVPERVMNNFNNFKELDTNVYSIDQGTFGGVY